VKEETRRTRREDENKGRVTRKRIHRKKQKKEETSEILRFQVRKRVGYADRASKDWREWAGRSKKKEKKMPALRGKKQKGN